MTVYTTPDLSRIRHMNAVSNKLRLDRIASNFDKDSGAFIGGQSASVAFVADTGGVAANDFAYVSGYDTTTGYIKLKKAQANAAATAQDLYWCPTAVTAAATGYARRTGSFTSALSGTAGDPVYLSAASAGACTLTAPTGTNLIKQVGSLASTGAAGIVSVDLGGEAILIHTHADNSQGGTISLTATTGTTGSTFAILSGGATAKLTLDTNSATGNFTQSLSPANLSGNQRITFPDAPSGDSVAYLALSGILTNKRMDSTTGVVFTVNGDNAANPKIALSSPDSGTGNFTTTLTPATTLTANATVTFPDVPGGTASVAYTSAKQSLTVLGSTSGGIVLSPIVTGAFNTTIQNAALAAAHTITLPAVVDDTHYLATTTNADGSVASTGATGTTATTFTVDSGSVLGRIIIDPGTCLTDKTLTLTNAALDGNRIITFPNATGTVPLLGSAQTFSAAQTFSSTIAVGGTATFTGAVTQTGATTFGTGTGAISLNGDITLAASADLTITSGDSAVDFGSATGTFSSPSGANTLSGDVTIASGKDLTFAGGDSAVDFSAGTGTFKTSRGAATIGYTGSSVTIPGTCTLATGTGAVSVNGETTLATTKSLIFGSAVAGTAAPIKMFALGAGTGYLEIDVTNNTSDKFIKITNAAVNQDTTLTIPDVGAATGSFAMLEATQTFSGAKTFSSAATFTAAPTISIVNATTDAVTDVLTLTKTVTGAGVGAAGLGAGVTWQLEDATGTEEKASLDVVQTDATQATSDVDFVFTQNIAGAMTETFRIDADGGVKIGKTGGSALIPTLTIFSPTTTLGSLKFTCADATGGDYALTVTNASQTAGSATLTIPDLGGAAKNVAFGDSAGAVAVANLAAAVQDLMPTATIALGDEVAHKRTVTVTVKDAAGNALAFRSHVRCWISTSAYGAPTAGNSTIDNVAAGTLMRTVEANAEITGVTEAAGGTFVFDLTEPDAATIHVMTEVSGRVYTGNAAFD